jgi:hypothetical protein
LKKFARVASRPSAKQAIEQLKKIKAEAKVTVSTANTFKTVHAKPNI